jgi:hypothetical protein
MLGKNQTFLDYLSKSPEERAEEAARSKEELARLEKESLEARNKHREEIGRRIEECDKREEVKFALEHSKEPDKITQYLRSNSTSDNETFQKLLSVKSFIAHKEKLAGMMAEIDGGTAFSSNPEYRPRLASVPVFLTTPTPERDELRELAKELDKQADYVFNNRKDLNDADPNATPLTFFTVSRLNKFLPTLSGERERLAYLIRLRDAYMNRDEDERAKVRSNGTWLIKEGKGFSSRLQSLINTLEQTVSLQSKPQDESDKSKKQKERRDRGGTHYQNLLAIDYLLWYAKANGPNTQKAKFASFLTGYGEESFRRQWSNIQQKADESGRIWEMDMGMVRAYFEKLGLSEIVKRIDNDLASISEKL